MRYPAFMTGESNHLAAAIPPKVILQKNSTYAKAARDANNGFNSDTPRRSEVHHIICEKAVIRWRATYDGETEKLQYISDCLSHVEWDINNADNLLGLPRRRQFRDGYVGKPETWVPRMWPCHQVDHLTTDGYSDIVEKWLDTNIWSALEAKKGSHKVDISKIKTQLEKGQVRFKESLVTCGRREGGTVEGWKNRHDPAWKDRWYKPFSMIAKANPRSPGRAPNDLTEVFKKM